MSEEREIYTTMDALAGSIMKGSSAEAIKDQEQNGYKLNTLSARVFNYIRLLNEQELNVLKNTRSFMILVRKFNEWEFIEFHESITDEYKIAFSALKTIIMGVLDIEFRDENSFRNYKLTLSKYEKIEALTAVDRNDPEFDLLACALDRGYVIIDNTELFNKYNMAGDMLKRFLDKRSI